MTIKHPEGMDFSWKEKRILFEIFLDQMYQANKIERKIYGQPKISISDYYEANQDFLLRKFTEEA